jgi:hypothetical protein
VQRILREQGPRFVQVVWQDGAPQPPVSRGGDEEGSERGMFGLWPAMGAKEELDGGSTEEEAGEDDAMPRVLLAALPPAQGLGSEDLELLRAALDRLIACRKLLHSALADQPQDAPPE